MASLKLGDRAPGFEAQAHDGSTVRLADFLGRQAVVVFFYPQDNTPVCTAEACAFRDAYEDFVRAGAAVIGVSGDSLATHQGFAAERRLPFMLVSDADGNLRRAFGVPRTLGLFPGRVTYVIDKAGLIRHIFNAPLAAGQHVREALKVVEELQQETSLSAGSS
jgi:peroxiredoxin Q/BCP